MNYFSTTPSNQTEIFNMVSTGRRFTASTRGGAGSYFDLEGEKMEIGKEVTVKYDLYKMVNYVLIRKLQNKSETIQVGGQSVANPWYNVSVDDLTLSFYQVGWENMGNWDCTFSMSDLSLKAYTK